MYIIRIFCPYLTKKHTLSDTKVLITTGRNAEGYINRSEILDMSVEGDNLCLGWVDYPVQVEAASAGFLGSDTFICGGKKSNMDSDECYILNSRTSSFAIHMNNMRQFAASIVLNETLLWISGGKNGLNVLDSTEFVQMTETTPGPNLPEPLYRHTMISTNNDLSMIIGGWNKFFHTEKSFYYDHREQEWLIGPNLNYGRSRHAAGTVIDKVTLATLVIVTGGKNSDGEMNSTEILDNDEWIKGK